MVRTRGGYSFRPRVRFRTTEMEEAGTSAAAGVHSSGLHTDTQPTVAPVAVPEEPQGFRRYQTRLGPRAPSPVPQRRRRKARPSKRARTSGLGESSTSRPQPSPSLAEESSSAHLSSASRIRRSLFTRTPIPGNVDLHDRDFHGETDSAVQRLDEANHVVLPASIYDTAVVLLSLGGASVLPLHDFPGSAESAGAPIHH